MLRCLADVKGGRGGAAGLYARRMSEADAIGRTVITIDDSRFELQDGATVPVLRSRIESALLNGGGFVDLVVRSGRRVAALITPTSRVVVTTEEDVMPEEPDPRGGYPGRFPLEDF